ncbi:MAG TPA: hypothetical protein VI172_14450 [Candidatus Dormibacteraeota bacterium]
MDKSHVVLLLAFAGTYDYRKTGDADVEAWYLAIGDLDIEDAKQAVVMHYRNTDQRMMPFHVRQGVKAIRDERRRAEKHTNRELPSPFERDINRQVRMEAGAATVREVLAKFTTHLEGKTEPPASAMEQLREITAGPDWDGTEQDGETR